MDNIELEVKKMLAKSKRNTKSIDEMMLTDSLQEITGLDSLEIISLTVHVEKYFNIVISDDDLLNQEKWMQTIGTIVDFVKSKTN